MISIIVWGFTPNYDILAAAAAAVAFAAFAAAAATAFAVATATTAATAFAVATAAAIAFAATLALKQPLRFLPVVASIAIEFIAIFLLFNYSWPQAAALGILILFGMRYLPERLVVRPAADN